MVNFMELVVLFQLVELDFLVLKLYKLAIIKQQVLMFLSPCVQLDFHHHKELVYIINYIDQLLPRLFIHFLQY